MNPHRPGFFRRRFGKDFFFSINNEGVLNTMSQFLSQSMSQQMRLEQRLTPQLIQSMAILQKPVAELEAYIQESLETNAALEIEEPKAIEDDAEAQQRNNDRIATQEREDDHFARLEKFTRNNRDFDSDWNDRAPQRTNRVSSNGDRDAKMGAMANTAGREISLHEHLLEQWSLLDLDQEVDLAGETIINYLDPDGYLRTCIDELSEKLKKPITPEAFEKALVEIHNLEPAGIGARDVIECLLLQLDRLPGDNGVERSLIKDHLDDVIHNRLPLVAKATGYAIGEINEAIKAMSSVLCLHPGYLVGDRSVPVIRPDVIVEYAETGGGLEVRLTRGNMPKLKISDEISTIAKSKENGKSARDFAKKHVEEAAALIDAVTFRRNRLLEVAKTIIEKQRDFFDIGPEGLKVCRMSDLATELECDPSTISRTVADKYMQSPRGIYPRRYFFTGGTETDNGQSMGWDRVKTRVRELVDAEDKKSPLNDDKIADLLDQEGIHISRRTVAKYRQQLDIPAARQRKKY